MGLAAAVLLIIVPQEAFAMHIMEAFAADVGAGVVAAVLPCLCFDLVACGVSSRKRAIRRCCWPSAGVYFVLSAPKIPSVIGSCSHPTGVGPAVTTLAGRAGAGAIVLPMAVIGPMVGGSTTLCCAMLDVDGGDGPDGRRGVEAGLSGDPSRCRGLSRHAGGLDDPRLRPARGGLSDPATGAGGSIWLLMGIFCLTQIPIAVAEGLLTVMIYDQPNQTATDRREDINMKRP